MPDSGEPKSDLDSASDEFIETIAIVTSEARVSTVDVETDHSRDEQIRQVNLSERSPVVDAAMRTVEQKGNVRAWMAFAAIAIFVATILITAAIVIWAPADRADLWLTVLPSMLPVETLLMGGATAFYYNHRQ